MTAPARITATLPATYAERVALAEREPLLARDLLHSIAEEERARNDCDLDIYWSALHAAEGCEDSLRELEGIVRPDVVRRMGSKAA